MSLRVRWTRWGTSRYFKNKPGKGTIQPRRTGSELLVQTGLSVSDQNTAELMKREAQGGKEDSTQAQMKQEGGHFGQFLCSCISGEGSNPVRGLLGRPLDRWQHTKKQAVLGDACHHSNACQFDFSFLCQGQEPPAEGSDCLCMFMDICAPGEPVWGIARRSARGEGPYPLPHLARH